MKKIILTVMTMFFCLSLLACDSGKDLAVIDDSTSNQSFTVNNIVATDSLGRNFDAVNEFKNDKYSGIFYFTLLNRTGEGIYDVSKLESTPEGKEKLWDPAGSAESPIGGSHYWGEPLYGYYNSEDEWVMRKHIELLTMANLDFLFLDATNGFTYDSVWRKMMPILAEYIADGWDVPQVVFYCNARTSESMQHLYNELYAKNYYSETWFKPHGKPLIIAAKEDGEYGKGYKNTISQEVQDFFEIKNAQWPTYPKEENALPWIDLQYPQIDYDGAVNISVIQHVNMPISTSVFYENDWAERNKNFGRGYSRDDGENNKDRILEGSNFEEQWDGAKFVEEMRGEELEYLMITGWNEWTVGKGYLGGTDVNKPRVQFVDQMNYEFSRDIEMMKGGYGDNYYLQLIRNLRGMTTGKQYKPYSLSLPDKFGLNVSDAAWGKYGMTFSDMKNDCLPRDFVGFSATKHYKDNSGRNDIITSRMLNTKNSLYVLVETADDIVIDYNNTNNMNIMLNTTIGGWEGYDYIVNRFMNQNGTASLERAIGSEYKFEKVCDINYKIVRNRMVVEIPLDKLSINGGFTIEYKVADNVTNQNDIMDYYVTGDSAPIGRLNYKYQYVK